jgi:hypothetical protein
VEEAANMTQRVAEYAQFLLKHPLVLKGIETMVDKWESNKRTIRAGKYSIEFIFRGRQDKRTHVFHIEKMPMDPLPRLVIYSGDSQHKGAHKRQGSPLVAGASLSDKEKLKNVFKIESDRPDEMGEWRKSLSDDTPPEFYAEFIEFAMYACKSL